MSTIISNQTKTKVLLTLTMDQKETILSLANAKGLSLSAFLRLKALEETQTVTHDFPGNTSKISKYLQKKVQIPKKFKDYISFEDFHKAQYKP